MGWRLRRSVKLVPGLRLNLGLGGLSLTAGPRGASVNLGSRGLYRNLGIPGTGISHRSRIAVPGDVAGAGEMRVSTRLDLDANGRLTISDSEGTPLEPSIERRIRREQEPLLRSWLVERCTEIENGFEAITSVHLDTPAPGSRVAFIPVPFRDSEPMPPDELVLGFWDRCWPGRRQDRERNQAFEQETYEHLHASWEERRQAHAAAQERERERVEQRMLTEPAVMEDELERALSEMQWPRETLVEFAFEDGGARLVLDVDLPEVEDLPLRHAELAARGLKLNIRQRTAIQIRRAYALHVHGVAFRLVGVAFAELPALQEVVCSGYSQRRDRRTAQEVEEYLCSVRVQRDSWMKIDFGSLEHLDPVQCLEGFEFRRELSATGHFAPVLPFARVPRPEPGAGAVSPDSKERAT